jgi:bile acid:Na+ symporter, BASS family
VMEKTYKLLLGSSAILGVLALGTLLLGNGVLSTAPFVIGALICLAIGGLGKPAIKQLAFTIWVIVAVAIGR